MNGKLGAALATLIVAVLLIAPWLVGQRIEAPLTRHLEAPLGPFEQRLVSYDRGWFSAEASSELLLETDDGPLSIPLDHRVRHGPWRFGWAQVESRVNPPEQARALLEHYFGERSPFEATTEVAFNGDIESRFNAPAFDETPLYGAGEGRIAWGGMTGHYRHSEARSALSLELPSLSLQGGGDRLLIDQARLEASGPAGAAFSEAQSHVSLGRLEMVEAARGSRLVASFESQSRLFEQRDGALALSVSMSADDVLFKEPAAQRPLEITGTHQTLALRDLPREPTLHLLSALADVDPSLDEAQTAARTRALLTRYLTHLAEGSPSLEYRIDDFTTPQGSMNGRLEARLEAAAQPADALESLLSRAGLALELDADRALLTRLSASETAERAGLIEELMQENILVADGDRLQTSIEARNRQLLVNGEPRPELFMLLLMSLSL